MEMIRCRENGTKHILARDILNFVYDNKYKYTHWVKKIFKSCSMVQNVDFIEKIHTVKIEGTNISQKRTDHEIEIESCRKIVFNTKNIEKSEKFYSIISEELGENFAIVKPIRKEFEFEKMIDEIIKPFGFEIEKQFSIINGRYKIDFIIAGYIAVEYDECHHESQKEKDIERMKNIDRYIEIVNGDYELKWIRVKEGNEMNGIHEIIKELVCSESLSCWDEKEDIISNKFSDILYESYKFQTIETQKQIDEQLKKEGLL